MRADDLTGEEYPLVKGHGLVYQEKIALPSIPHPKVTLIVWTARHRQRRLMKKAEVK